jgi:hypothetical protein
MISLAWRLLVQIEQWMLGLLKQLRLTWQWMPGFDLLQRR